MLPLTEAREHRFFDFRRDSSNNCHRRLIYRKNLTLGSADIFLDSLGGKSDRSTELLIVLGMNLEETLRVKTCRTYFRRLCSNHDMPAVSALPYLYFALLKYLCRFNVLQKGSVTFLMMFLDFSDQPEPLRKFR